MNLLALLAVSGALVSPDPTPPDVSGWTQKEPVLELEFRVDDYRPCFVGTLTEYQNPNDSNEFVRVYRRHVALVSERPRGQSDTSGRGTTWNRTQSDLKHHEKALRGKLEQVRADSDAFGYVRWRLTKDPRTGQDYRSAPLESWLADSSGRWTYAFGKEIKTSPYTEPRANDKKTVLVGRRFALGDTVHILRVRENDLVAPKLKKEDKDKKEAGDAK